MTKDEKRKLKYEDALFKLLGEDMQLDMDDWEAIDEDTGHDQMIHSLLQGPAAPPVTPAALLPAPGPRPADTTDAVLIASD